MSEAVSNQAIWESIQQMRNDMLSHFDSKMDPLQSSLKTIQGSLTTIAEHVKELEQHVSANEEPGRAPFLGHAHNTRLPQRR